MENPKSCNNNKKLTSNMNEYHEWKKKFAFNFKSLFDLSKKKIVLKALALPRDSTTSPLEQFW